MSSVSVGSLQAAPSSARPDTTIGSRRAILSANRFSSKRGCILVNIYDERFGKGRSEQTKFNTSDKTISIWISFAGSGERARRCGGIRLTYDAIVILHTTQTFQTIEAFRSVPRHDVPNDN